MDRAHRLLFDLVCLHGYFAGQPCAPLHFAPTDACRRLLERYRLRWRPVSGGVEVYYPVAGVPVALAAFNEAAPFTFALRCGDPALLNYTDIGFPPAGGAAPAGLYYFDNLACHADGAAVLLHAPDAPFAEGRLPLAPPRLRPGMTLHARLDGRQLRPVAAPGRMPATPDPRGLPEGRYGVRLEGRPAGDFYLGSGPGFRPWGVAAIYGGGSAQPVLAGAACPIGADGTPLPRSYRIALAARRCTWRYHVVARRGSRAAPAGTVVAVDQRPEDAARVPPAAFAPFAALDEIDGRPAAVFDSTEPLALLALPDNLLGYSFRPDGYDGSDMALPYAGPAVLAADPQAAQGFRADMFVYI